MILKKILLLSVNIFILIIESIIILKILFIFYKKKILYLIFIN